MVNIFEIRKIKQRQEKKSTAATGSNDNNFILNSTPEQSHAAYPEEYLEEEGNPD